MKIQRLSVNKEGRDFVCGDLHGAYARVIQFCEAVKFDESKDRLICVGDLIDRGLDSLACLQLLDKPWFFSVTGNHEVMMKDFYQNGPYGGIWNMNGGGWRREHEMEVLKPYAKVLAELPLLITVETSIGRFHVLHAELPLSDGLTDETLSDPELFTSLAEQQTLDGDFVIWGRRIFRGLFNTELNEHRLNKFRRRVELEKLKLGFGPQLSHIYSGHTILQRPVTFMGQTDLDTAAYYSDAVDAPSWAGLTVTEPASGKFWLCNGDGVNEVQPVII